MDINNTKNVFSQVNELLSLRYKRRLLFLIFLSIVFAGLEAIGISLIMPFVSLATNTAETLEKNALSKIFRWSDVHSTENFIVLVGFVIGLFYFCRGIFILMYVYLLNNFTWNLYYDLTIRLFSRYLNLSYKEFTQLNSSQLEKNIITEATYLSQLITSVLRFFAEAFVGVLIYIILLITNLKITVFITIVIAILASLLILMLRQISSRQGMLRESYQSRFYHLLNNAFGNLKFTKQISGENQMIRELSLSALGYCRSNTINTTMSQVPPTVLETLGITILVGIILYSLSNNPENKEIIPLIAMYGLAMYRIMPAGQRMLYYYSNIIYYRRSLDIIHSELTRSLIIEGDDKINFNHYIKLDNISFGYLGRGTILKNLNLYIGKNEKIAIIGDSGSGKTTLLDHLIGIHLPDKGRVLVDGVQLTSNNIRSWRRVIGYIPQSIFLFDGTIADNVAFGKPYVEAEVICALKRAHIWDFLQEIDGLQTHVGDGGIKLSGGQKQRIGIARALYGNPKILVLDEATSALDQNTEAEIMKEVHNLAKEMTLIVVSHQNNFTDYYDQIYKMDAASISIYK